MRGNGRLQQIVSHSPAIRGNTPLSFTKYHVPCLDKLGSFVKYFFVVFSRGIPDELCRQRGMPDIKEHSGLLQCDMPDIKEHSGLFQCDMPDFKEHSDLLLRDILDIDYHSCLLCRQHDMPDIKYSSSNCAYRVICLIASDIGCYAN